jgi:hypothetical protein
VELECPLTLPSPHLKCFLPTALTRPSAFASLRRTGRTPSPAPAGEGQALLHRKWCTAAGRGIKGEGPYFHGSRNPCSGVLNLMSRRRRTNDSRMVLLARNH